MRLSTTPHSVEAWGWHSEAAAARDEKEGPLRVPVLRVAGERTQRTWGFTPWYAVHIQVAEDTAPGFPEEGCGAFPRSIGFTAAERQRGDTKSPSGAPVLLWRSPRRPAEHLLASCCLSTSVAGPEDGQTPGRGPGSRGPCSPPTPLLDRVLNCPPLSRAAAEDEIDASQAPVLHL